MILTCPSCGTQYAVKNGSIPNAGRKVRCAACGHSWHQEPEPAVRDDAQTTAAAAESQTGGQPAEPESAEPVSEEFREDPQAYEPVTPDPPGAPLVEPPNAIPVPPPEDAAAAVYEAGPQNDQWDISKELPDAEEIEAVETETRSDRNRNWVMAIFIAIAFVVAIALALWFVAPDSLRQQVGFPAASASPLQIAPGTPERQKLASGNELVVVSGRVINPSSQQQQVPAIEAQLHDSSGRLLYSWTIAPPARFDRGAALPGGRH
jgi:predicted Zn finger-like uncharacterized protein